MFSVRLVTADSYQAQPLPQLDPTFSVFRGSEIKNVPVIRVFGTTPKGEKTCLHVHGVFPYLYVPYTGEENEDRLAYRLAASLDAAINISLGTANSTSQHVYQIQRLAGIPFYGYHGREHQFLKISFYNPAIMKKAADLLQTGAVLGQSLQPHEAHLNYTLQFMMDYNLYGMSFINLSSVKHRRRNQSSEDTIGSYNSVITPMNNVEYLPVNVLRQSVCELEIDAIASDILNREDLAKGIELNPGLSAIWNEEKERRRQAGLVGGDSQLVNPKSPQRPPFRPTDSDLYQEQRLARRLLMISQSDESTLSMSTNATPYPAEVTQGDIILNASNFGSLSIPTCDKTQRPNETLSISSLGSTQSSPTSHDCSVLDPDDLPLVELLENLARDSDTKFNSVDEDSVLGTQGSLFNPDEDKSDEETGNDDLNLTCFELNSWNSWEGGKRPSTQESSQSSTISDDIDSNLLNALLGARLDSEPSLSQDMAVPQLDGAGDFCSLLDSEEEENMQMEVERVSQNVQTTVYTNQALITNAPHASCPQSIPSNPSLSPSTSSSCSYGTSGSWSSVVPNETYLNQYNGIEYEHLDDDFVDDIENIMQENIMMDMNFSVAEEVLVSSSLAENETIPIERVLNGDPCFTQTAELDKSDLTELQNQYVSLLDSELLTEIYENTQNVNLVNNIVTEEPENCHIDRQVDFIDTEIVPQDPQSRDSELHKQNCQVEVEMDNENYRQVNRLTSDSSDYNCNIVATWEELQDMNFLPKGTIKRKCTQKVNNQAVGKGRSKVKSEVVSVSKSVCETPKGSGEGTIVEELSNIKHNQLHEDFSETVEILPHVEFSPYLLGENENLVSPVLADFEELVAPLSPTGNSAPVESNYSSDRSHRGVIFGEDQHRHCVYSFNHRKFVQDYVFTSNEIWVIEKRKRGKTRDGCCISSEICSEDCRLPYVPLEKISIEVDNGEKQNIEAAETDLDSISSTLTMVDNTRRDPDYLLPELNSIVAKAKVNAKRKSRNTLTRITRQSERNFIQSPSSTESGDGPVIIRRIFEEKTNGSTCIKKRKIILKVGSNTDSQSDDSRIEDKSKLHGKIKRKLRRASNKAPTIHSTVDNVGQLSDQATPVLFTPIEQYTAVHLPPEKVSQPIKPAQFLCSIKTRSLGMKWLKSVTSKYPSKLTNQKAQSRLPTPRIHKARSTAQRSKPRTRRRGPKAKSISSAVENEKVKAATSLVTPEVEPDNLRELGSFIYKDDAAVITETQVMIPSLSSSLQDETPLADDETTPVYTSTVTGVNLYSGKDYTIDAVSQEIPQLLFAEDSNASFHENTMDIISVRRSANEIETNSIADHSENSSVKSFDGDEYSDHESGILSMADDSGSNGTVHNDTMDDSQKSPKSLRALLINELQKAKRCERCERCDCNSYMTMLTKSSHTIRTGSARSERIYLQEENMSLVTKSIFRLIGDDACMNDSTTSHENHLDTGDSSPNLSSKSLDRDLPDEGQRSSLTPKSSPKKSTILRKIYSSNSESPDNEAADDVEEEIDQRKIQMEVCYQADVEIGENAQRKSTNRFSSNFDSHRKTDNTDLKSISVINENKGYEANSTGTKTLTNDEFRRSEVKCSKAPEVGSCRKVALGVDNNTELIMNEDGDNTEKTQSCTEMGERFSGECASDRETTSAAVLFRDYNYKSWRGTENIADGAYEEDRLLVENADMHENDDVSDSYDPMRNIGILKKCSRELVHIDETTRDTFVLEIDNHDDSEDAHSNIRGIDDLSIADTIIVGALSDTSCDNYDKLSQDSEIQDDEFGDEVESTELSRDAIIRKSDGNGNSFFTADTIVITGSVHGKVEEDLASRNEKIHTANLEVQAKNCEECNESADGKIEENFQASNILSPSVDYIDQILIIAEPERMVASDSEIAAIPITIHTEDGVSTREPHSNNTTSEFKVTRKDESIEGKERAKISVDENGTIKSIPPIEGKSEEFNENLDSSLGVKVTADIPTTIEKQSEQTMMVSVSEIVTNVVYSAIGTKRTEPEQICAIHARDNDSTAGVHSSVAVLRGNARVSVNNNETFEPHSMTESGPIQLTPSFQFCVNNEDSCKMVETIDENLQENPKMSIHDYSSNQVPSTVEQGPGDVAGLVINNNSKVCASQENSMDKLTSSNNSFDDHEIEFLDSPEPSQSDTINIIINNLDHDAEVEEDLHSPVSNTIAVPPESTNGLSESTSSVKQFEKTESSINRIKQLAETLPNHVITLSSDLPTTEVQQSLSKRRRVYVKLERLHPDLVRKYLKTYPAESDEETRQSKTLQPEPSTPEVSLVESNEIEPLKDDSNEDELEVKSKLESTSTNICELEVEKCQPSAESCFSKVPNRKNAQNHPRNSPRHYPKTPSERKNQSRFRKHASRRTKRVKISDDIICIDLDDSPVRQLDDEVPKTSNDFTTPLENNGNQTSVQRLEQSDESNSEIEIRKNVPSELNQQNPEPRGESIPKISLPLVQLPRLEFTRKSKIPSKRCRSPSSNITTASISSSEPLDSSILSDLHPTQSNRYVNTYVIQSAYRTKHHTVSVDNRLVLTRIVTKDSKLRVRSEKENFLVQLGLYPLNPDLEENWVNEDSHVAYIQRQEPKVALHRLNAPTLKRYGYAHRFKSNKIGKRFFNTPNEFKIPAYDGPADLTSSESDSSDNESITVSKERRVCSYRSGKTKEILATPTKRKNPNSSDNSDGPAAAKSLRITPKRTPNRPSMLKSPGRLSGNYTPLKIIVTSPKVRREASDAPQQLKILADGTGNSSAYCHTPRRRGQGLHENLLRGRISIASPIQSSGSKLELTSIEKTPRDDTSGSVRTRRGDSHCKGIVLEELSDDHHVSIGKEMNVRKNLFTSREPILCQDRILSPKPSTSKEGAEEKIFHKYGDSKTTEANARSFDEDDDFELRYSTLEHTPHDTPRNDKSENNLDPDEDDDNLCDITFTQYIGSQLSKKTHVSSESSSQFRGNATKSITITPRFNPPSLDRVKTTLESYGIPKCRNPQPFFSKQVDACGQKELAHRMLKVPGTGLADVAPFKSAMEGSTGLTRWRRLKINEFHPSSGKLQASSIRRSLAGHRSIIITPSLPPPALKDVTTWIKAREYLKRKREAEQKANEEENETVKIAESLREEKRTPENAESDENTSDSSDSSIVGPSPEKVNLSNSLKLLGRTPGSSQVKRMFSTSKTSQSTSAMERSMGSDRSTPPSASDKSHKSMNPTFLSMLEKSKLFETNTSKHPGMSYGQIECASNSTRSDVAAENMQNAKAVTTYQYITLMCVEVHVTTRGELLPDPDHDPISAIIYAIHSDVPPTSPIRPLVHGVIAVAPEGSRKLGYTYGTNVPFDITLVHSEAELFESFVTLVTKTDPEIFLGWELEALSWGYIFQRATSFGVNLNKRISRIPGVQCKWETTTPDLEALGEIKLPGRVVLDIWRIMRHEMALLSYSFENVMYHVMNERVPCPSFQRLTEWWDSDNLKSRWKVIEHYGTRVLGVLRILEQLDIIGRTSEHARLFGIQFYEVFTRGSQFRVESIMLRLAKPLNYIAVSPSPQQRAAMRAMEALPLILEPESVFYSDPIIVLDFQSLYPSIIIAHNYCFSTCLGRIERIGQPHPFEFGASVLKVTKNTALKLEGKVNFAPCGVAFVKPEVRLGILPRMLTEILETRFMVKKAMKDHDKTDKTLQRVLHSRQLGLKFLANVTYGYTAANFTGRMPCMEVGDSVVSKAKETLERAIKLVESTTKWGVRVVYGDTDSLFILASGKSKEEAFKIGYEIADAVTADNPSPVKLKMEKILYPTILQTKKRYCGYMYETPDQKQPTYLAKGIETVRRDGCPAVSKMLEKTLKILFETKDVSEVKQYVIRQFDRILRGKVSLQDLTFAKEFRGMRGYKERACVPALELTRRLMKKDPRALPRHSERVKYVIVAGAPNQALIHCVRSPWEVLNDPGLRPNVLYYITRVIIPPLNRCLNLMGVDVNTWYREMPHRHILHNPIAVPSDKQKQTIFQYFGNIVCVSCSQTSNKALCYDCKSRPSDTLVMLNERLRWLERVYEQVTSICQSCIGRTDVVNCVSLDCPVLYRRAQSQRELTQEAQLERIIKEQDIDFKIF